jgi:hypothetical protein
MQSSFSYLSYLRNLLQSENQKTSSRKKIGFSLSPIPVIQLHISLLPDLPNKAGDTQSSARKKN